MARNLLFILRNRSPTVIGQRTLGQPRQRACPVQWARTLPILRLAGFASPGPGLFMVYSAMSLTV